MTGMLLNVFALIVAQLNGELEMIGSHEAIRAVVGGDVILPCHLEPPFDVRNLTVEWKLNATTVVHKFRSRADDPDSQDETFKTRTSLFHDEMHTGNISLNLTNVSLTDAGRYTCYVPKLQSQVKKAYINLTVDPEKGPEHQLVDNPTGGVVGGVVTGVLVAAVVIGVSVYIVWKNKCQNRRGPGEQSNSDPAKSMALTNSTNNADNTDNPENLDKVDNTHTVGNTELGN